MYVCTYSVHMAEGILCILDSFMRLHNFNMAHSIMYGSFHP